jgi:hypothetical protein
MALKNKKVRLIEENYDKYKIILEGIKNAPISPIKVSDRKENHRSSLYKSLDITHNNVSDKITLRIEIRENNSDFSISIDSSCFPSCQLLRYDSGDGTHRNNFSEIPLGEQSVPTPHFHRYNDEGYSFAYKTDKLKNEKESEALSNIEFGFSYFCQESNIKYNNINIPTIFIQPDGVLNFSYDDSDPLENINFA